MARRLSIAIWLLFLGTVIGSSVGCHFLAAFAVFDLVGGAVPDSNAAGTIAGEIFDSHHLLSFAMLPLLVAGGYLMTRKGWLDSRQWPVMALLVAALFLLLVELAYITPTIETLRAEMQNTFGGVSDAPPDSPVRQKFGAYHGISILRAFVELAVEILAFLFFTLGLLKGTDPKAKD